MSVVYPATSGVVFVCSILGKFLSGQVSTDLQG